MIPLAKSKFVRFSVQSNLEDHPYKVLKGIRDTTFRLTEHFGDDGTFLRKDYAYGNREVENEGWWLFDYYRRTDSWTPIRKLDDEESKVAEHLNELIEFYETDYINCRDRIREMSTAGMID